MRLWQHLLGPAALAAGVSAAPAGAACTIGKVAELPVTMEGMGPMIDARINGTPVRLMADSGSFWSVLSPGNAQALHLPVEPGYFGLSIRGINGSATASVVSVRTFTLAGQDIPHVQFVVAGSETRGAGVLGQNVLGLADAEYDLPHGAIRLMRSSGRGRADMAYWAQGRSVSVIAIDARSPRQPHTIGTVRINGKPIRATFDTGASTSILSLAAAARAGIRPGDPGVVDGGVVWGFGRQLVRTWIAPLQSFAVGDGEEIHHARVRFGAIGGDLDMLLGADFFIAHRVYVDNRDHRLFLTYEGGPVFNLKARFEGAGGAPAPIAADGAPGAGGTAEADAREGAVAMSRNDPGSAVAAFAKAIEGAPAEPRYRLQRAEAYARLDEADLARRDLDEAIRLSPDFVDALLARATLDLRSHHDDAALVDLQAADRAAPPTAMARLTLAGLFTGAAQPLPAIAVFSQWIRAHPDDVRRPLALNGRCWARALAGRELDAALKDCDAALHARPGTPAFLDSRGMVRLRLHDDKGAIADYDAVLAKEPRSAWSLYGRGIARRRLGDAGAQRDVDAAVAVRSGIADEARRFGIDQ